MHHAVRGHENPALDVAVCVANHLELPVVVYQGLAGGHRFNSDRHHTFIMEGARDVQHELAERGIAYVFNLSRGGSSGNSIMDVSQHAALVIAEEFPAPPFPRWTHRLSESIEVPVWCVDAHCIVPMQSHGRRYDRAFQFRRATTAEYDRRVPDNWVDVEPIVQEYKGDTGVQSIDLRNENIADLCAACDIDHSVGPVAHTPGGSTAGYRRWMEFLHHGLESYARLRNDAATLPPLGVSRLSPYLHHGHVSPFRIAREAHEASSAGTEKFLDELLIWRELAYTFCFHEAEPETLDALPSWASSTLDDHRHDPRPFLPSWERLARGRAGNPLWDTAQRSLLAHGELHNNVRMTWGKLLPAWTDSPESALQTLIDLNHRYALDGNDPNSYGGLLWCLGLFDRPFTPEKPIYGTVRTRSAERHAERLDLKKYATHIARPARPDDMSVAVVGAGISGLVAARTLADHNVRVRVFDKGRSPGGRASTRRRGDFEFDHGAQYFTARDERFVRYVRSWLHDGVVERWDGLIGVAGGGATELKSSSTDRYVGVPGMSAVARHLAKDIEVDCNVVVSEVARKQNAWELANDEGESLGVFDVVIVTLPPEQATRLLPSSSELHSRVQSVQMQPCWAAMAVFESPLSFTMAGLFLDNEVVGWAARNNSKPGRPSPEAWVLHATPEWSRSHIDMQPEEAYPALLKGFADATGVTVPPAQHSEAHLWRFAQAAEPLSTGCLWDPELGIGACGDWCHGSRIEGAFLSGMAAAGRVMSFRTVD